jgi:hypothetical protein
VCPKRRRPSVARVVGGVDPLLHVAARFGEHLAHLAGGGAGDLVLAGGEQVAHAAEDVAAGRGGGALVMRLERDDYQPPQVHAAG